jgi:hypothetical protein
MAVPHVTMTVASIIHLINSAVCVDASHGMSMPIGLAKVLRLITKRITAMAVICMNVLTLAQRVGTITTPLYAASERNPVIKNSRIMIASTIYIAERHERSKSYRHQNLVCQRVHELTETGGDAILAGIVAIIEIGQRRNNEDHHGPEPGPEIVDDEQPHKDR